MQIDLVNKIYRDILDNVNEGIDSKLYLIMGAFYKFVS